MTERRGCNISRLERARLWKIYRTNRARTAGADTSMLKEASLNFIAKKKWQISRKGAPRAATFRLPNLPRAVLQVKERARSHLIKSHKLGDVIALNTVSTFNSKWDIFIHRSAKYCAFTKVQCALSEDEGHSRTRILWHTSTILD